MFVKRSAAPDLRRGSSTRVSEYTTSSAVTSRPWWKCTPLRRVNVHVSPSREARQNWASDGVMANV